jgi:predicted O-methyltransferase YrrM
MLDANVTLGSSPIYKALSAGLEEFLVCLEGVRIPAGGSGPLTHLFLADLIWGTNAQLVYEIGMNAGTCSLRLLNALQYTGGKLRLFEAQESLSPVYSKLAEMYPGQVEVMWGNSANTLPTIANECPDVVFVDGDHAQRGAAIDIRQSLEVLSSGGFIVVDDWDYPTVRAAAFENIPGDRWFIHGSLPGPQVAYYQKR